MQKKSDLAIVLDYFTALQKLHKVSKSIRLIVLVSSPDTKYRGIRQMLDLQIGLYVLFMTKAQALRVRPISRSHPVVIAFDYVSVGSVVSSELDGRTLGEVGLELKNVPHSSAAKPENALVLVADYTKTPCAPA